MSKDPQERLTDDEVRQKIALRAYEIYEDRGGQHGRDIDDWRQAESDLRAELAEKRILYTFRHSYRAWLGRTRAPIEIQQELMRHANIQTTLDTYGKELKVSEQHREANSKVVKMILPIQQPVEDVAGINHP